MQLVSTTMLRRNTIITALLLTFSAVLHAQENSPYSRYGLGDLTSGKHILNRGMGGVAAAYGDYQSVNFTNPASYSNLYITTFDLGVDLNSRTLKDIPGAQKYTSNNLLVSYVQIGIPLINSAKALQKKRSWGMTLGLQPLARVSYKIETITRQLDSLQFLNEGSGGAYYAFAGTGYKIKNFSAGINFGYLFGTKDINNRKSFFNDSLIYAKSNSQVRATYGSVYFTLGAQYDILLKKGTDKIKGEHLKLGAYGSIKQKINAKVDTVFETFEYDALGGTYRADSIYIRKDVKSKIDYPSTFGFGFIYEKENSFMIGADFSQSKWSQYRFDGVKDYVTDSWMINVGGQFTAAKKATVEKGPKTFRAGVYYGKDIMSVTGDMPVWGVTLGAGIPMYRSRFSTQYTIIHTLLEIGSRGKKSNVIKENFFRVGVGLSLGDLWFRKYKYQ